MNIDMKNEQEGKDKTKSRKEVKNTITKIPRKTIRRKNKKKRQWTINLDERWKKS